MVNNWTIIPTLQGLCMDHKGDLKGNPVLGPKLRPLAATNKTPKTNLGNMIAKLSQPIGKNLSSNKSEEIII